MNEIPLIALFIALVVLIIASGFFSGSETGLMTLNRYRLRHRVRLGHRDAQRVSRLLERPDRLIGLILLGNNFANVLASSLATVIAIKLLGDAGIPIAALLLTLILLVFGEVAPKTLAALHPERIAYPAAFVLWPLLKIFYPLVWIINLMANYLLQLLGVKTDDTRNQPLSPEELRTVVMESSVMIPRRHQQMLLSILDLEEVTVDDIMVPRNEMTGVNLEDEWPVFVEQLSRASHPQVLVYRGHIEQIVGFIQLRQFIGLVLRKPTANHDDVIALVQEPYFIPEGTPLNKQLLNFQKEEQRIGLVVDEYGDILGLVTLEDILDEIVGEVASDAAELPRNITARDEGGYFVDGGIRIRTLNRALNWQLPTDGPKTLNGLIMEHLESIPEPGTSFILAEHPVEIVEIAGKRVKTVLIHPRETPHESLTSP